MVIWTQRARTDLKAIHDYIAKDSHQNAQMVVNTILQQTSTLAQMPHKGKKVPDLKLDELREISIYSWRIIYHLKHDNVYIVTVIHKRRNTSSQKLMP